MTRVIRLARFEVLIAAGRRGPYAVVYAALGPDLWNWWTRGN